jgi:cyclopropane-fatty-acyl-phospholipid synthase
MNSSPVAPVPELANQQHYEVPAEFFEAVLGRHGKYSCAWWGEGIQTLDQAEAEALRITCERAGIEDGMEVLDLGCGWGSLSLWIARKYPACRITAVSNSTAQRRWIEARAGQQCLDSIKVITADMNHFSADQRFDRVVSVEMFEHMRNYHELLERVASWLKPEGRFFMHIFCHRNSAYEFIDQGPGDWMSRHFFSGGIMPSADLPLRFQQHLSLINQHVWHGTHYARTAEAWLDNLDRRKAEALGLFSEVYGADKAGQWLQRWRIFFMSCAELFAFDEGQEWFVGHYLFSRRSQ